MRFHISFLFFSFFFFFLSLYILNPVYHISEKLMEWFLSKKRKKKKRKEKKYGIA